MALSLLTDFFLFDIVFLVVALIGAIWVYFHNSYKYWENKGVPYLEPTFPRGNNPKLFSKKGTFGIESMLWYDALKEKGHKFGGVWTFATKALVLVDPEYIKDILTKDFQYFVDRHFLVDEKNDPQNAHLFNIGSHSWKDMRQRLTPTFTSGKMKMMFHSVLQCSDYMVDWLKHEVTLGHDIDSKELFASFTTDVIGSCAFGIECNSFKETEAEFRTNGKKIFEFDIKRLFKLFLIKNCPEFCKKIGIVSTRKDATDFFAGIVKNTIEYRRKNDIKRPDFIQLLMEVEESTKNLENPFNFNQMVANTILFFLAGFDTSSTVMNFTVYELARNPEMQEKTRNEIEKVLEKYNGEITYEALHDMTYLRQVIDETLRLYPPVPSLGRVCIKNYQLRDTDIVIEKGTAVVISALGLGRDPEYFPDPERFDPDRFAPEKKTERHPYVHIPFGEGPRNCVGLRFGVMQSEIGLIRVLRNFKLSISPKTKMPLTLSPDFFLLKSVENLYVNMEKI